MSQETLQRLQSSLQDWEAHYHDVRHDLHAHDIYFLWLRLFRLSRLMIRDHNTLVRRGTLADGPIAYTGETKRLADM